MRKKGYFLCIIPIFLGLVTTLALAQVKEAWVARYKGGGEAIAVDLLENVYVAGSSLGVGTGSDFATIKYDTNGKEIWVARYNGPDNGNDGVKAMAIDSLGGVYVVGTIGVKRREPYTINREIWLKQTESRDQRGIDKGGTVGRKESIL